MYAIKTLISIFALPLAKKEYIFVIHSVGDYLFKYEYNIFIVENSELYFFLVSLNMWQNKNVIRWMKTTFLQTLNRHEAGEFKLHYL